MGIGFVLFIAFLFCMGVACGLSILFGLATSSLVRQARAGPRNRAIVAAAALPMVSVVLGLLGFIGYAMWCETKRGVDPGMGDEARVPLGSGYELSLVDTPDLAYLRPPVGHEVRLERLRLGVDEHAIYFETAPGRFHLIEKGSGTSVDLSEPELVPKLQSLGSPGPELRTPGAVYSSLRWGLADLLAVPMIFGVPALVTVGTAAYVWKVRRGESAAG